MTPDGFSGVYAATITPYDGEGRVSEDAAVAITRFLASHGLSGTCPAGTTGEFPFLDRNERALATRAACAGAVGSGARVVAGVWAAKARDRAELTREASAAGAAAVFLTTPYYYPATPEHLFEWYRAIRRASDLPVFAYNIPQFTTNEIPLDVLDILAAEGTIQGYKDSSPSPDRLRQVVKLLKGRISVFAGSENLFPLARNLGVDGFISGMANAYPRTILGVWKGDAGADERLATLKEGVSKAGGVSALKRIMAMRGFSVGEPREPISPVASSAEENLARLEREFGRDL
jgi:4-hydroxy-tetrahydrodipicolinate synthase